jgi:hypothetical protein
MIISGHSNGRVLAVPCFLREGRVRQLTRDICD